MATRQNPPKSASSKNTKSQVTAPSRLTTQRGIPITIETCRTLRHWDRSFTA